MSFTAMAGPFDTLTFDQEPKDNVKKLTELNKHKGFTVLWWNVAWGHYNNNAILDNNLLALMNSPTSPAVITLGEFKEMILMDSTKTALREVYKYYSFVPYSAGDVVGIAIFSKYPFRESVTFDLDWTPMKATTAEAEAYRKDWTDYDKDWVRHWRRTFAHFQVHLPDGTTTNIVPVHLASPWMTIHRRIGNWKTFRIMMTADENPLLHQQMRLTDVLEKEFGDDLNSEAMILLGDFNIPSKVRIPILGGKPKMYKLLQGPLTNVLDSSDDTFPSKSSHYDQTDFTKKHPIQIDHIFHNKKVNGMKAEVLHLKGSDHYPLLMIAK
ncbi:MAG TPA: endonuclease/exonuclease/phosphatase family protein [Bacteriovoracaceae bacterium]|nr:endonuclease/exonuclease/phosphatase family protein [Bacteriovoracaceae bacterium]